MRFATVVANLTYDYPLDRNPYVSIRPKRQERAFPLALLSSTLVGVLLALVANDWNEQDCATPASWDCGVILLTRNCSVCCHIVLMAPIPPSRRRGFQFRAEELDDLMDLVESFLPISAQNWQAVADVHLENYRREARTAESLRRKFQEISRRTGPTGDPNCPPYVIKAKRINRQLIQMIDASSGGSEAGRSDDGLSDASDSGYEGAGEFANVINDMNNNAAANGGEEEIDEEEDADDAGIGVQGGLVWRADEGQPSAVDDDGVAPPPDGDAPPDGVAPAVARPRGRGPGRSRTLPIGPPAHAPPAAAAVARNGSAAPAPAVARNGSDGQMSGSSGTAAAPGGNRGHAFRTPINHGRKKSRTNDDDDGCFSMSNVMGMMMVQQRSEQSSREADCMEGRRSYLFGERRLLCVARR